MCVDLDSAGEADSTERSRDCAYAIKMELKHMIFDVMVGCLLLLLCPA